MERMKHFLMGGSLVPLGLDTHIPVEEWEKSFRQMHELGLNSFRMFLGWARVERKEGVLDFSQHDYAFSLAEKYHLSVTVNVGGLFNNLQGYTCPAWLFHGSRLSRRKENPLLSEEYGNPDMRICSDDPIYREKAFAFIRTAVERYRDHPALESWSVWNEPHGDPCYCACTLEKFRKYLRKKYGDDLALLNEKWGSLYPVDFPAWEEVRPLYQARGKRARIPVMAMDFFSFCRENYIETFNEICRIVHELDPVHTTTFNMQGIHGCDMTDFHVKTAGISAYFEAFREPRKIYLWANLYMRSARMGLSPGEKVRILETDSGPRPDNEFRPGCQKHQAVCDWSMIAMGAEQILAWMYRTRLDGGHALQSQLCDFDGAVTPRLKAFAARAKTIRENERLLLSSHPFPGQLGVWWDVSQYHSAAVEGLSSPREITCESHDNALMAALDSGYQAEFVNDRMVLSGEIGRFRALLVPFHPLMTDALAERLREFVRNGGLL
ncbi:MAG: beta-galactosidase, partial [Lentisphaeria bacterium]|nr:beta-galactosidase [Lentisphaeria bacterium]